MVEDDVVDLAEDLEHAEEPTDLDFETGLFPHFSRHRVLQGLTVLYPASGHRPRPVGWGRAASDHEECTVGDHDRPHGEAGLRRDLGLAHAPRLRRSILDDLQEEDLATGT